MIETTYIGNEEVWIVRNDWIYLIVTVGRRLNSYRIAKRKPKSLKQNEFAYQMYIEVNMDDWENRIKKIEVPKVQPPNFPKVESLNILVEKDTALQVIDRLKGEE